MFVSSNKEEFTIVVRSQPKNNGSDTPLQCAVACLTLSEPSTNSILEKEKVRAMLIVSLAVI